MPRRQGKAKRCEENENSVADAIVIYVLTHSASLRSNPSSSSWLLGAQYICPRATRRLPCIVPMADLLNAPLHLPDPADPALTRAMRQYVQFKAQHPDYVLFFRMGDFYEMFWEDARLAHRALGVTLTTRSKDSPNPVP